MSTARSSGVILSSRASKREGSFASSSAPISRISSKVMTMGSLKLRRPSRSHTITFFRFGTWSLKWSHLSSCSSFSTKKKADSECSMTYCTWGQALVA